MLALSCSSGRPRICPKNEGILPPKYEAFEKNMMINLHFGVCDSSRQPDLRVLMSHVFHQDVFGSKLIKSKCAKSFGRSFSIITTMVQVVRSS